MFLFTKKPSSGSHSPYLAKTTSLVQSRYRGTDVVIAVAALYDLCDLCVVHCASVYACTVHITHDILCRHSTDNVCTTSISTL